MKNLVYIIQSPPFWLKTPPLSLVYLKTYLKAKGIPTKTLDLNFELFKLIKPTLSSWLSLNKDFEEKLFSYTKSSHPEILERIYKDVSGVEYIGLSILKRNQTFVQQLAEEINKRFPNKKIIFGGPETLFSKKDVLKKENHYLVIGQGEKPFYKIINNGHKKVYEFDELEDLDNLPLYDLKGFGPLNYSQTLPLLSSRGCPQKCNFCSERLLAKKFRFHSPEYIVDQITHLKNIYKTNSFVFLDSLINYKEKWLYDFSSLLIKKNLQIKWEAQIRVKNNFPKTLAKLMKASGCFNLFVGLESGSDKMLKLMNKGFTTEEALGFFKRLTAAGLHFETSLILGYPGEDDQDFKTTRKFIVKNKEIIPKIAQLNPFVDYLNEYKYKHFPSPLAKKRVSLLLKTMEKEKIRHTKSFINNLTYPS
tara:strand:- start:754 stop:2013 length:1260 start_codon:yes stop_codon:yes gene_type:complete